MIFMKCIHIHNFLSLSRFYYMNTWAIATVITVMINHIWMVYSIDGIGTTRIPLFSEAIISKSFFCPGFITHRNRYPDSMHGHAFKICLFTGNVFNQMPLKALVNIVVDRRKEKIELCWLTYIIMFKWMNERPRYKK